MACPTLEEILPQVDAETTELLGRGAQGSVYKIGEFVLKTVNFPTDANRRLFEREKEALETLSATASTAPYMPALCWAQLTEEKGYILQRYEPSVTLESFLESFEDRPPSEKWDPMIGVMFIVNLGKGVNALHRAGFLHRDLKPQNILVRTNLAQQKVPILIDFGIACRMPCEVDVLGTPEYVPSFLLPTARLRKRFQKKLQIGNQTKRVRVINTAKNLRFNTTTDKYALSLIIEAIIPAIKWSDPDQQKNERFKKLRNEISLNYVYKPKQRFLYSELQTRVPRLGGKRRTQKKRRASRKS